MPLLDSRVAVAETKTTGKVARAIDVGFATTVMSIHSARVIPGYDADVVGAARSLMLISDVSVR